VQQNQTTSAKHKHNNKNMNQHTRVTSNTSKVNSVMTNLNGEREGQKNDIYIPKIENMSYTSSGYTKRDTNPTHEYALSERGTPILK